jgi:predicted DNA-binding antitoxin AbrB/MazE fold protein
MCKWYIKLRKKMASSKIKALFFWALVGTFLIVAPIIVFHAMGYRFNTERGIFIYSGSVTLKSAPAEIEVLIDNESVPKGIINFINHSYHIDGLTPGGYSLEVKSPQYKSWRKEVSIHSGVSTEFWNIFLARENYTKLKYPSTYLSNFFISPDSKKIVLVEGESNTVVKILDVKKESIEYIFSIADYAFSENVKENVEWSPREGHLSIPLTKNGKNEYFIVDIGTEEVSNLNNLIKKDNIRNVRWSSGEKNTIFYIYEDGLYKLKLSEGEKEILVVKNIAGYDISADGIYYFSKENGLIYEKNNKGSNEGKQISFASVDIAAGDDFKLIAYDEDRIGIISQNKDFYLFNKSEDSGDSKEVKKIKEGINGLHFSNDGKKVTFWNDNEIFVYFVRKWETQPNREEGQVINIVHFSEKIENVGWFRDYEHIIFNVGNTVKIAELDHRSLRNIHDLFDLNNKNSKITYTVREDNVFFIDAEKNSENSLYSISLSEENEI